MKWLKRNEWNLVIGAALLAFACSMAGLNQFLATTGKATSWLDMVYFTFRLFLFSYDLQGEGQPYAPAPPLLQIARFLAPTTVGYAAVKGFLTAAAYQVNVWRLQRWEGHAVRPLQSIPTTFDEHVQFYGVMGCRIPSVAAHAAGAMNGTALRPDTQSPSVAERGDREVKLVDGNAHGYETEASNASPCRKVQIDLVRAIFVGQVRFASNGRLAGRK